MQHHYAGNTALKLIEKGDKPTAQSLAIALQSSILNCTLKAWLTLQMEISMAQKASTSDTRRATGTKPMMSSTRTCHQASPLQTLGADPVLPGLHKAMMLIDIAATTWLVPMLPTSRLRPLHLCKQQARCVHIRLHTNTERHQQCCQSHALFRVLCCFTYLT